MAVGLLMMVAGGLPAAAGDTPSQVDETPLPLGYELAFPELRPRRPIDIVHAGDGSNRLFVVTQQGVLHVFPNRPDVSTSSRV
jgi:hypothetical protein